MSKHEIRQALASGGLSLIAKPKRTRSPETKNFEVSDAGHAKVETIQVEGVEIHSVKVAGPGMQAVTVTERAIEFPG